MFKVVKSFLASEKVVAVNHFLYVPNRVHVMSFLFQRFTKCFMVRNISQEVLLAVSFISASNRNIPPLESLCCVIFSAAYMVSKT